MAPSQPSHLTKRYCVDGFYNDCDGWWSSDGYYVRYAVVAAIFAVVVLLIVFAYLHAQRRLKKGQAPLAYHRWLVRRRGPYPPQNNYVYYSQPQQGPYGQQQANGYPMNAYYAPPGQNPQGPPGQAQGQWAPPPPAYGQHNWDVPPTYAPPVGASKANANQNIDNANRENGEGSMGVAPPPQAYQAPTATRSDHTQ